MSKEPKAEPLNPDLEKKKEDLGKLTQEYFQACARLGETYLQEDITNKLRQETKAQALYLMEKIKRGGV